jgi:hypothetical protein
LLAFVFPTSIFGQGGVSINKDNSLPDQNAILDVKSKSQGVLLPRLTTEQRTGITMAVPGLTVFDSETFSYWVYLGDLNGGWAELLSTLDKHWDRTGTNIFNTNLGNVGIGTSNPTQKLAISAINPTIDLMHVGISKAYVQGFSNDLKLGTYDNNLTGSIIFNTKGSDRMWISETGNVGIATSSPTSALTIGGTSPRIQMKNGANDKGYFWASGNDIKVGTNAGNATGNLIFQTKVIDRMVIDELGRVGIGTTNPASSSVLTINDNDPLIQLENDDVSKGFVQLVGDDIKIGTNISNPEGTFIVRTNGSDRVVVDEDGDVTINSSTPGLFLQEDGTPMARLASQGNDLVLVRSFMNNGGTFEIRHGNFGLSLFENGNANIGSGLNPAGYNLSVEGKVIATDFTTLAINSWPDYVFSDDYKLRSITEVDAFIKKNHHLPNIPKAKEIEENGVHLGDMSKRLMEKVEELTLYVIQLNQQNVLLQQQIDELKNKVNK